MVTFLSLSFLVVFIFSSGLRLLLEGGRRKERPRRYGARNPRKILVDVPSVVASARCSLLSGRASGIVPLFVAQLAVRHTPLIIDRRRKENRAERWPLCLRRFSHGPLADPYIITPFSNGNNSIDRDRAIPFFLGSKTSQGFLSIHLPSLIFAVRELRPPLPLSPPPTPVQRRR